jgi:hypothetical protein
LFLSRIVRHGKRGYHIEDIVVRKCLRGRGIGKAMVQFAASLAEDRGMDFVAWECEETNAAQKMYRQVGAVLNEDIAAVRLSKDSLIKAMGASWATALDHTGSRCSVSTRFSLFRTMCHNISGYDMNSREQYFGLQIEDLEMETSESGVRMLVQLMKEYHSKKELNFIDLIVPKKSELHWGVIDFFDAKINTYSGSPVTLWELRGGAFKEAAEKGKQINRTVC